MSFTWDEEQAEIKRKNANNRCVLYNVKVLAIIRLHGIRITDSSTNIPDLGTFTGKRLHEAVTLNR